MSTVLTLNGGVLVSNGSAITHDGGSSANIQTSKSYTVSTSGSATIEPDTGYDAMEEVVLTVPSGTEGTPTATKGTVSSHSISITPSVTNTGGYITGGTQTGTAVSVSASELVSGTYNVTSSGTKDVTNYESASVPSGTATAPASISGTSASVTTGTNTLTLSKTVSVTPNVSTAGFISSGTAGNSSVSLTASVTTKAATTFHPSTTDQTISSGTYTTGTQTFKAVTTSNLTAGNIKKDVVVKIGDSSDDDCVTSITGTYEGSGGTVTLKPYAIRPDAELLQTYSDDFLVVTDKSVTIPAYVTSSTTLITGGTALTPVLTLSNANYRYLIVMRYLTIPQYNITTTDLGRQEYTVMSSMYEIPAFATNVFSALVNTTKYASRNVAVLAAGNAFIRCIYWSSATAIKPYTANSYGCAQTINTAPAISSGTAASPTLTFYTPNVVIRGSSTYLSSTYWSAITDIRCQYIYEVYRIPASTSSTYGIDGWGHYNNMNKLITCAQSSTHKLT